MNHLLLMLCLVFTKGALLDDAKDDTAKPGIVKNGGPGQVPDQLLVALLPRVEVTHARVLLSDVATLHGPAADVLRFGNLELFPAPSAGKPRLISSVGICLAARLAGLFLDADRVVGASQTEVVASWSELASEELFAQAQRWILQQSAELGDRILLERLQKPAPVPLLSGGGPSEFQFAFVGKARGAGQVQVKITVVQGETVVGERLATFKVRRFGKQMRLLTDVRKGESITPAQLLSNDGEWTALTGTPIVAAADVEGLVAARDLTAGTVVTRELLEAPVLVERGDTVQLVLRSGGLEIIASGLAQRQGRRGEVIPVLNAATQKVIQAELIARGSSGLAVALVR